MSLSMSKIIPPWLTLKSSYNFNEEKFLHLAAYYIIIDQIKFLANVLL
jgi:hypothetical protein